MFLQPTEDHWLLLGLGQIVGFLQTFASIAAAWIIAHGVAHPDDTFWALWIVGYIALTVGLNFALVLLHELGHAFAAWSVGHRVLAINVRGLSYVPLRRQFFIEVDTAHREYAGFVAHEADWGDDNTGKSIWISLGGPLATGSVGLILFLLAGQNPLPLFALAAMFGLDMVFNLMPLQWSPGARSDGLHIVHTLLGHKQTPDDWAAARLAARPLRRTVVSEEEWTNLREFVRQPFVGGKNFRRLLAFAANEHNDHESMAHLPDSLLQPPLKTDLIPEN